MMPLNMILNLVFSLVVLAFPVAFVINFIVSLIRFIKVKEQRKENKRALIVATMLFLVGITVIAAFLVLVWVTFLAIPNM